MKEWVVATLGGADKPVLVATLVLVVLAGSAVAGVLEARRPPAGRVLVAAAGTLAAIAAVTRAGASALAVLPSAAAIAAGILALAVLLPTGAPTGTPGRRRFLAAVATWVLGGAAAAIAGNALGAGARSAVGAIGRVRLPRPVRPLPPLPAGAAFAVPGLTPLVTPNPDFYRVDIALAPPAVDPAGWMLEITGMVARPLRLSFRELLDRDLVAARLTLACVSNPIGGGLVGSATWLGLPVRQLLREAGPAADADMVLSTGADGFTAGTPLPALLDGRNALLAVGMNGVPLPQEHGFPVRLVVPGLYGYVSATKWLTRLEVTRFDRAEGYWTPRGWSAKGPVKLSSRVDVPRDGAVVQAGEVVVAGMAWEQHVGIARVEVALDDGPWQEAELSTAVTDDWWRQWRWRWAAERGEHRLRVRATDRRGRPQVTRVADVAPNGATGLHTIHVRVG